MPLRQRRITQHIRYGPRSRRSPDRARNMTVGLPNFNAIFLYQRQTLRPNGHTTCMVRRVHSLPVGYHARARITRLRIEV